MENEERNLRKYLNGGAGENEIQDVHQWVLALLDKYVSGTASLKEKQIMDALFDESVSNIPLADRKRSRADKRDVWINLNEVITDSTERRTGAVSSWISKPRWLIRIAVFTGFIVLGCAVGVYWYKAEKVSNESVITASTQSKTFNSFEAIETRKLPDGTTITLNRNTEVTYDSLTFNQKNRFVRLNKGEAFFEVTKNDRKPFIVSMGDIQVLVIGTSFNLKIYEQAKRKSVTVQTGKVTVLGNNKKIATLLPDHKLEYDSQNSQFKVSDQNSRVTRSWMNGNIVFVDCGAKEIGEQIYMYYKVPVVIENQLVFSKAKFNSIFPSGTSLEKIAGSVASIYSLSYKIVDGKLIFYTKAGNNQRVNE